MVLGKLDNPTDPFPILEPCNPSINDIYVLVRPFRGSQIVRVLVGNGILAWEKIALSSLHAIMVRPWVNSFQSCRRSLQSFPLTSTHDLGPRGLLLLPPLLSFPPFWQMENNSFLLGGKTHADRLKRRMCGQRGETRMMLLVGLITRFFRYLMSVILSYPAK